MVLMICIATWKTELEELEKIQSTTGRILEGTDEAEACLSLEKRWESRNTKLHKITNGPLNRTYLYSITSSFSTREKTAEVAQMLTVFP